MQKVGDGSTKSLMRLGTTVVMMTTAAICIAAPTAYVTSETAGVGVIDLDSMTLRRTLSLEGSGSRGLSLTADGSRLLVANRKSNDVAVIDTSTGVVLRRIQVGRNPEYVRVHDGYAYVTYEPGEAGGLRGKKGAADGDDAGSLPAEIAIVDLTSWRVVTTVKSGRETEGIAFARNNGQMLVTNEGDDTISIYDARTGVPVKTVTLPTGSRPRGIATSPDGQTYIVTLESANRFVVIDASSLQITRMIETKSGPYGVAFDPSAQRILVAASRAGLMQVYDARSYKLVTDVPIGQRCWHFTFTPDDARLLVACGRSNAVHVFDAHNYRPVTQIGNLPLAWGIVTYPRGVGSIESN